MSRRAAGLLTCALLAGCSNLTEAGNGIVALEVAVPFPATVEVGSTLTLAARALDRDGNAVAATITWLTPDPTVTVDPQTGVVTGVTAGTGRVQAVSTALASELVTLTVVDPPVVP